MFNLITRLKHIVVPCVDVLIIDNNGNIVEHKIEFINQHCNFINDCYYNDFVLNYNNPLHYYIKVFSITDI